MEERLIDLADQVSEEQSFLRFVAALIADREKAVALEKRKPSSPYGPDAGGWENASIEMYLEAAKAWAEDSDFGRTMPSVVRSANNSPWKLVARFLLAGKYYE